MFIRVTRVRNSGYDGEQDLVLAVNTIADFFESVGEDYTMIRTTDNDFFLIKTKYKDFVERIDEVYGIDDMR